MIDDDRLAALARMARYRVTSRDLRLISGLVLFVYVSAHLLNHTLGLVSLDLAERGLGIAVAVWHSTVGTMLLYGAAAIHLALAMVAVYERRTLRMPWTEALRIAAGFSLPLLLIGHFASTRVGFALYGLDPDYHRVVRNLWMSGSEGRQLALLAPGWLHGCFGLYYAFGRRAFFQRALPLLLGAALALPVLAALGFLEMARELHVLGTNRDEVAARFAVTPEPAIALAHVRDLLLAGYVGTIMLVALARAMRDRIERYRGFITIAYPQRAVRVPRGSTVLEASRACAIPHRASCAGRGRCSTCRVQITGGIEHCPAPRDDERRTLERIRARADVRLACQLRPEGDLAVVPLAPHDRRRARFIPGHNRRRAPV